MLAHGFQDKASLTIIELIQGLSVIIPINDSVTLSRFFSEAHLRVNV